MRPNEKKLAIAQAKKKCPNCAEFVQPDAKTCRFCQHSFVEEEAAERARLEAERERAAVAAREQHMREQAEWAAKPWVSRHAQAVMLVLIAVVVLGLMWWGAKHPPQPPTSVENNATSENGAPATTHQQYSQEQYDVELRRLSELFAYCHQYWSEPASKTPKECEPLQGKTLDDVQRMAEQTAIADMKVRRITTSPKSTEKTNSNDAIIELGQAMVGEVVKPQQTLIRVIQSPPGQHGERGDVCFVYYDRAVGPEYVIWVPENGRTLVFHSNGLAEVIPTGRVWSWDNFTPSECKAGRDENFRKVVRRDILKSAQN
jgi:hypothetical protein